MLFVESEWRQEGSVLLKMQKILLVSGSLPPQHTEMLGSCLPAGRPGSPASEQQRQGTFTTFSSWGKAGVRGWVQVALRLFWIEVPNEWKKGVENLVLPFPVRELRTASALEC